MVTTKNPKELRRLLSTTLSQRQSSSSTTKKINHPFAKYENNKLACIVCTSTVKSEGLWNAHLASAGHKEQLKKLKEVKEKATQPKKRVLAKTSIRSLNDSERRLVESEAKEDLVSYNDYEEDKEEEVDQRSRVKRVKFADDDTSLSTKLPSDFFETQEMEPEFLAQKEQSPVIDGQNTISATILPKDFFDDPSEAVSTLSLEPTDSIIETAIKSTTNPPSSESALPNDFFDDSAKGKGGDVQQSTEIEQEWVLFQKLIAKETQVSNMIAEVDEEELQRDRDEMQEREQEQCLKRLERLKEAAKRVREKQNERMVIVEEKVVESENDMDEDDDEDEDDEWMDWRAQKLS